MSSSVVSFVHDSWSNWPTWARVLSGTVVAVVPAWLILKRLKHRERKSPLKEDWKKDVVYLYQFPPSPCIPNISPFCLKLETWLRMAGIKYESVYTMLKRSKEGTLPFVELNGHEYDDSAFIIRDLTRLYGKSSMEAALTPEQDGIARALEQMVEQSAMKSYGYIRYTEHLDEFFDHDITGLSLPWYLSFLKQKLKNGIRSMKAAGIGKHSRNEIVNIGLDDLRAVSKLLGEKQFFFGDKPYRVDCTMFGHLAQVLYVPMDTPHKRLIDTECRNLKGFCDRMKQKYWADWDQVCAIKQTKLFY